MVRYVVSNGFKNGKPFTGSLEFAIAFCIQRKEKIQNMKVEPLHGDVVSLRSFTQEFGNFHFLDINGEKQTALFNKDKTLVCEKSGVIVSPISLFGWKVVETPKYQRIPCSNGLIL